MIAKAPEGTPGTRAQGRRARHPSPLEVRLSLKVNFGVEPGESVILMNERRIPMVNSVFENRDRILRSFVMLLMRASMTQPKVVRELVPALKLVGKLRGKS